jgi:septum formation protein
MKIDNNLKLILASSSKRRKQILQMIGFNFSVKRPSVDEKRRSNEKINSYVMRIALEKINSIKATKNSVLISADTVVKIGANLIGKPLNKKFAYNMLKLLQNRTHTVITGVAVKNNLTDKVVISNSISKVTFTRMTDDEIKWYLETNEGLDKAGAYAVQGKGALFIKKIDGSFFNVMGLPIQMVYKMLKDVQYISS